MLNSVLERGGDEHGVAAPLRPSELTQGGEGYPAHLLKHSSQPKHFLLPLGASAEQAGGGLLR